MHWRGGRRDIFWSARPPFIRDERQDDIGGGEEINTMFLSCLLGRLTERSLGDDIVWLFPTISDISAAPFCLERRTVQFPDE